MNYDSKSLGYVRRWQAGFTLIELMIVVVIIGILAAIALPNFLRLKSRAKQSEAKMQLKAIFGAQKTHYAENGTYKCGLCGWSPEANYTYNYFLAATAKRDDGKLGCPSTAAPVSATQDDDDPDAGTVGGFTSTATANIDADAYCDAWVITDLGVLTNPNNDAEKP